MSGRVDIERILDAFLTPEADRLPDRVIDAALDEIARSPQRRALRVPWRFPPMTNTLRAAAGIAIVAIVGVGVLALNSRSPGVGTATPTPTPSPTVTPTPTPVASGTASWTTYTSAVHGFDMKFPDGWSSRPATRTWRAGDTFGQDDVQYADVFSSPGNGDDQVALFVWEMPTRADLRSYVGLGTWAKEFCSEAIGVSCETFAEPAVPMCLDACSPALLVPTADAQFAFFMGSEGATEYGLGDQVVRVVVVTRKDAFPAAARFGGSVELLKMVLTTMGVTAVDQQQTP
jgi:hypothetical protein